ncbi:MAG: TolC family protein, partial [Myxococcota bacterium]
MSDPARFAALMLLAAPLAGCAIGPNYERPEVAEPEAYRGQVGPAEAASLADLPWWEIFSDPALQELLREALENNYDLRQAAKRVEQAQALVGATRSEFFPQIDYGGGASRQQSALTSDPDAKSKFNVFFGVFKLAWEIDVWGRIRRGNEAARAQMLASEDFRRGVLLTLVSQVAQAYFELLEIDRQLQISRDSAQAFQETLDLFTRRFEGGVGSRLQTTRAEAALAQAAATIPDLESRIVAKENQLSILLGRAPGPIPRGVALVEQTL